MKRGLQIEIQLLLTSGEWSIASDFVREFIDGLGDDYDYKKWSCGGWKSSIGRNKLGHQILDSNRKPTRLFFRRLSKRRRIFGVVRLDELVGNGCILTTGGCTCPQCQGHQRVKWKTEKPETVVVYKAGDIKG